MLFSISSMLMKKLVVVVCLVLSMCIFFVNANSNDWLRDSYKKSHNPWDWEPYSITAEARDMFDTQIDLIWSIKKWLESNGNVNDLIEQYQQGESLWQEIEAAIQAYLNSNQGAWDKLALMTAIDWAPIDLNDSLFVRTTRFMMKAAVVLSIPMIIFAALKMVFSLWSEEKLKDAVKQVGLVAGWILLVLFSVMIIYLITSLTRSSLWGI
jgi:hypothetical protein